MPPAARVLVALLQLRTVSVAEDQGKATVFVPAADAAEAALVEEVSQWVLDTGSLMEGEDVPGPWNEAACRYRRASRERASREKMGSLIIAVLGDLRALMS
ncbi:MAG: hypothetical protein ACYC3S_03090 [Chloroflexota bacterium]